MPFKNQTEEVSEYFYFTNLYFSMMLQRSLLSACQCVHLSSFPFLISSFPSLLLSFLSLFTSCSSLHPCFTCFLHFFLSFVLKSIWPISLLYFLHSYYLFPLSSGSSSSSVFPSLLISFRVPLSFLCLFLLSFVLLSFLLYLNLTSSFFLVFYIYSHRASDFKSHLSVWFFVWVRRHLHFTEVWLWQPYLSFTHLSNQEAGRRYWTSFPLEWP